MDHVINSIRTYLDIELDLLADEWQGGKGKYKKLSDCPFYSSCKAMIDAIHTLEKYYYGKAQTTTVRDEMQYRFNNEW